ncbi:MAG: hypothetical protein ABSC06_35000 [Rhodopila sp.]|jgi:hypothetical protein
MSKRFPVHDLSSGWWLAPDTPPPPVAAYAQEILVMLVLDEITGLPPDPALTASTTTAGLLARADSDRFAGLAGVPLTRFLATSVVGAALQLTLSGAGYVTRSVSATLPAQPGYPETFFPANLGSVTLHRAPVSLTGRVVDATFAPLNGATVTVDGIWPTLASMQNGIPAAPNLIALLSPLYADRDATATVAAQVLTATAASKTLLLPGNPGDGSLRLSDQVGLAASSILGLDQADPQRGEYVSVASITDGGLTPLQPATALLHDPLARPHGVGVTAIPMTAGATGTANALSSAAQAGDVTLFPATMGSLDTSMTALVISGGGPAAAEYHAAGVYLAGSDANGRVVLPPLHRLAQLNLRVHHPSQTPDLISTVVLPFGAAMLTLDLAFP